MFLLEQWNITILLLHLRGLRKLVYRHLAFGMKEMYKGFRIAATVKNLQEFVPSIQVEDVMR